jgi:hypothetical protein
MKGSPIISRMIRVCLLIVLTLLCLTGCNQQAQRDSEKLDAILLSTNVDVVQFVSPTATNTVIGEEARKVVSSLHRPNRISHTDWTKQQVQGVRLLNGTNEICWLSLGEDGSWEFGAYGFRTRQ